MLAIYCVSSLDFVCIHTSSFTCTFCWTLMGVPTDVICLGSILRLYFLACAPSHLEFVGDCMYTSLCIDNWGCNMCMHIVVTGLHCRTLILSLLLLHVCLFCVLLLGSFARYDSFPGLDVLPSLVCHKSVTDPCILHGESYASSCGSCLMPCFYSASFEFAFTPLAVGFDCNHRHSVWLLAVRTRLPCHHCICWLWWYYFSFGCHLAVSSRPTYSIGWSNTAYTYGVVAQAFVLLTFALGRHWHCRVWLWDSAWLLCAFSHFCRCIPTLFALFPRPCLFMEDFCAKQYWADDGQDQGADFPLSLLLEMWFVWGLIKKNHNTAPHRIRLTQCL